MSTLPDPIEPARLHRDEPWRTAEAVRGVPTIIAEPAGGTGHPETMRGAVVVGNAQVSDRIIVRMGLDAHDLNITMSFATGLVVYARETSQPIAASINAPDGHAYDVLAAATREDAEAAWFAREYAYELLAPADAFTLDVQFGTDLNGLVEAYNLSPDEIVFRARLLGIDLKEKTT